MPQRGNAPRENLAARRVEPRVHVVDERRAGAEREQLGQEVAQAVADGDRAIGPVDRDVDVEAEAVVAPDDVAQDLVVAAVVRRVDDPLLLPGAPRVRAGRCERDAGLVGELVQLLAPLADSRRHLVEGVAAAGADLDLGGDQLADEVLLERRPWAAACSSSKRLVSPSVSGRGPRTPPRWRPSVLRG